MATTLISDYGTVYLRPDKEGSLIDLGNDNVNGGNVSLAIPLHVIEAPEGDEEGTPEAEIASRIEKVEADVDEAVEAIEEDDPLVRLNLQQAEQNRIRGNNTYTISPVGLKLNIRRPYVGGCFVGGYRVYFETDPISLEIDSSKEDYDELVSHFTALSAWIEYRVVQPDDTYDRDNDENYYPDSGGNKQGSERWQVVIGSGDPRQRIPNGLKYVAKIGNDGMPVVIDVIESIELNKEDDDILYDEENNTKFKFTLIDSAGGRKDTQYDNRHGRDTDETDLALKSNEYLAFRLILEGNVTTASLPTGTTLTDVKNDLNETFRKAIPIAFPMTIEYESEPGSGESEGGSGGSGGDGGTGGGLSDADRAKLDSIQVGATDDQTAVEIRDALQTLTDDDRLDAEYISGFTINRNLAQSFIGSTAHWTATSNPTWAIGAPGGMSSSLGGQRKINVMSVSGNTYVTQSGVNLNIMNPGMYRLYGHVTFIGNDRTGPSFNITGTGITVVGWSNPYHRDADNAFTVQRFIDFNVSNANTVCEIHVRNRNVTTGTFDTEEMILRGLDNDTGGTPPGDGTGTLYIVPIGGGIPEIETDDTLTGTGTEDSRLGVAIKTPQSLTGTVTAGNITAGSTSSVTITAPDPGGYLTPTLTIEREGTYRLYGTIRFTGDDRTSPGFTVSGTNDDDVQELGWSNDYHRDADTAIDVRRFVDFYVSTSTTITIAVINRDLIPDGSYATQTMALTSVSDLRLIPIA